jgi:hypothetical protein
MKFLYTLAILMAATFALQAQDNITYSIGKTVTYDAVKLEQALLKCTLDRYRREDRRVTMKFEDGTKVELFSAAELKAKGVTFDYTAINNSTEFELESTFILHPDGFIIEEVRSLPTLEDQKMYIIEKQNKQ